MPFCTACGKQNPDDARFCAQCGTRLVTEGADGGSTPVADVVLTLSSGAAGGVSGLVQVRVDSATGPVIADAAVGNTGGWDTSRSVPANSASVTGVHPVYVTFASGQPAAYAALWSVQFRRR